MFLSMGISKYIMVSAPQKMAVLLSGTNQFKVQPLFYIPNLSEILSEIGFFEKPDF